MGRYYDVDDHLQEPIYDCDLKQCGTIDRLAKWPDRWGNYIGPEDSVPEDQKYWLPTPEQRVEIMKQYEKEK